MEITQNIKKIISDALKEDIGNGDITTLATIPRNTQAKAKVLYKQPGIVAGIPILKTVFELLQSDVKFTTHKPEGSCVESQTVVLEIEALASTLLQGERTALNFIQHLSGVATLTSQYVSTVKGTNIQILDTRKTTPNLRVLEKYAVQVGGGLNYRHGLFDAVMVKDNHIYVAGGISKAVDLVVTAYGDQYPIIVEASNLEQVKEATQTKATRIMLDNMDRDLIAASVDIINGQKEIEVSGGMTPEKISKIRDLKIDYVSVGAVTNRATALDISMKITALN